MIAHLYIISILCVYVYRFAYINYIVVGDPIMKREGLGSR